MARAAPASGIPTTFRPPYPWKTRIALPAILLLSLVALLGYSARAALWPAVEVRVVPVVLKAGTESTGGTSIVQAAGWVEPDPYPITATALADGVVKEVLVLEGQDVAAGQVVARLVDDDAKLALARADAELSQRKADLTAAQRQWEHPVEQRRAAATAAAAVAETEAELQRLDSEVATEAARVEDLADQLGRIERNFAARVASEQELTSTRLKLKAQQAILQATQARRPVLEAQLRQRQAEHTAAREDLSLRIDEQHALESARAAVAMAEATRDEAALRLERMQVQSPVNGVVMSRLVEPGSKLMLGMEGPHSATAVRLYDPKRLQVRVDVPLADAARIGAGMKAKVVVGVLPDRTFDGEVTRVLHEADVAKNTLQVKVAIQDPDPQLKPEMLARVQFIATSAATASGNTGQLLFAPEPLIQRDGGAEFVWVVDRGEKAARKQAVEIGAVRQEGWVSISSGLNAGDLLIANPSDLSDGTKVRILGEAELAKGADHGVH